MNTQRANQTYDVLVNCAKAPESMRRAFIHEMTSQNPTTEWRFQGVFGFGGKYWTRTNTVSYYTEDQTKELDSIQEYTNSELKKLESIPA